VDSCFGDHTLVELVEGRADDGTRDRIEAHAAHCESCRRVLSSLARGTPGGPVGVPAEPPRVGRYIVERELGAGGMGVVYAARDPELDRTVAIKLLRGVGDAAMHERLRREAQALAKLAHPNVVAVHDVGTFDDGVFVAMEYVPGVTLGAWAKTRSRREIIDAYVAAGRGLAAAHAAGIVHRDFKPDNVLVGDDHRVRVADFGLARAHGSVESAGAGDAAVSPDADTIAAGLTASGAIVGTPYYMAPEQYCGEAVEPRSDQFSFCVALYTSLYAMRPFDGDRIDELWDNIAAGRIREPPVTRRAPRRIHAALRRGMALRPDARFPTMDALLAELRPRARAWLAVPAVGIVAIAAVVAWPREREAPCTGAEAQLAGVWDGPRKLEVIASLAATQLPYAEDASREVVRVLDHYALGWRAMHTEACEATRIRGDQTEDLLALRMACLDTRLHGLDGLASTLVSADRTVAERAVSAAHALPAIAACADLTALQAPVRPPNADIAKRATELAGQIARLNARRDAGVYRDSLPAAKALARDAQALGYRPVEASAHALVAILERDLEDYAAAKTAYEQAVLAAEAGRDDHRAASSLIELIAVVGHGLGRPADVAPLRDRARALLERLDHPPQLEATLLEIAGDVEVEAGELDAADKDLTAAIAAWERLFGPDDLHVVDALRELAHLELERGRGEPARRAVERALAIQHHVLGDAHPDLAQTIELLGGADYALGRYADAAASYLRALAIYERTIGPDSVSVANVTNNLATVYEWQGKTAEAIALHRRAVAIDIAKLGAEHTLTLAHETQLASSLVDDKPAEALAILGTVLASQRKLLPADHQDIAQTIAQLGVVELALHHDAAARDHAREAMAMFRRVLGESYNPHAELRVLGEAELGLGDPPAAADTLAQAKPADATDPGSVAWGNALFGRALIESGRDPARGRRLVADAWKHIAADARMTHERAKLAAWMAAHPVQ
jgi:tetratricopeptide (TPR) repeat protein/predicted Ser/Thr protein kinase